MRILIVAQDLRISGTSEGIVSRSFVTKIREAYPLATIEVQYLKNHNKNIEANLLPINSYNEIFIKQKINRWIIFLNRIYWRLTGISLKELYIEKQYGKELEKIQVSNFDLIFLRSSGTGYELLLGALCTPELLRKSVINFHDPFPVYWDTGSNLEMTNLELQRLKRMKKVVDLAYKCITPSRLLSHDMEFLYGTNKVFHTVPHQFDITSFSQPNMQRIRKKRKNICISYHGAVQFKRNIDILIDAFIDLSKEEIFINNNVELVLRIRGNHTARLIEKYHLSSNVFILDTLPFIESYYEQKEEADILVLLENCSPHSNILPGKTPVLASLNKPIMAISPKRSELRRILLDDNIANCNNPAEVKLKLLRMIKNLRYRDINTSSFTHDYLKSDFLDYLKLVVANNEWDN
ncbi:hypothetical protein L1I30_10620 [Gillisia sp. M10.2A]|uniref:Uncharacterized protein n=1 Tax=Gillisia lutea TaxID=2909668 RepID=A0ABS9EKZ4_9FLAO|nr:hypothetical protein [Gillisia lutea]MCF4102121.1 hypothetical protein [Gillisia lutea]